MKKEYNFTNAKQEKFYVPIKELDIPIYSNKNIKEIFLQKLKKRLWTLF